MPLEIIRERQVLEGTDYRLSFCWNPKDPHWGYGFDCDKDGNVDESKLHPTARESLAACRAGAVDGTPIFPAGVMAFPYRTTIPAVARCSACGGEAEMHRSCGAWVCGTCDHHQGMVRCFCGWTPSGADGRAELVEMGETIDDDY